MIRIVIEKSDSTSSQIEWVGDAKTAEETLRRGRQVAARLGRPLDQEAGENVVAAVHDCGGEPIVGWMSAWVIYLVLHRMESDLEVEEGVSIFDLAARQTVEVLVRPEPNRGFSMEIQGHPSRDN